MLGEIISAGANLIGGIMGNNQAKAQTRLQKQFAQEGIQWKVEDAKKAGVSPLFALGAPTHSYSPVNVGALPNSIAAAGQDIGRAVASTADNTTRLDAYTKAAQALALQKTGLENELLATQIAKTRQSVTPPMPGNRDRYLIDGQPDSGLAAASRGQVNTKPMERQSSATNAPSQEAAAISDVGYSRTPTGYAPVYSKDLMDRQEEDWIGNLAWNIRNRLMPSIGAANNPPDYTVPGKIWVYNVLKQEYQLVDDKKTGSW